MADTIGMIDIQGKNFERAVKGFANKNDAVKFAKKEIGVDK